MNTSTKRKLKAWIAALSMCTASSVAVPTAKGEAVSLAEVRRACESALAENTPSALERFLAEYPPRSIYRGVACYALAEAPAARDSNAHEGKDKPGGGGGGGRPGGGNPGDDDDDTQDDDDDNADDDDDDNADDDDDNADDDDDDDSTRGGDN
jgi:hypothetical protein